MEENKFLGTGMKFPPQIDPATGRFLTVSGNQTVKEAIYLVLMTQLTERIARPEFGSDIMSYTFMDTGTTMISIFKRSITEAILENEPRIDDLNVDVEYDEARGAMIVRIDYLVASTNTRDNLVFPFYLERGEEELPEEERAEEAYYYDGADDETMMIEGEG